MRRLSWWQWAKLTWTGRDARRLYLSAERRGAGYADLLTHADHPGQRLVYLVALQAVSADQARLFPEGWGREWIANDRMDRAESLRWASVLYGMLADVERTAAFLGLVKRKPTELEQVAGPVLDRMCRRVLLGDRMALLPELYRAVCPVVGVQAAEVVRCLPYPDGRVVPAEKSTR